MCTRLSLSCKFISPAMASSFTQSCHHSWLCFLLQTNKLSPPLHGQYLRPGWVGAWTLLAHTVWATEVEMP